MLSKTHQIHLPFEIMNLELFRLCQITKGTLIYHEHFIK